MRLPRLLASIALAAACATKSPELGSLAWTRRTGGELLQPERREFVRRGLRHLVRASVANASAERPRKLQLSAFAPPQTPIVSEAIRMLESTSHPAMVKHCFRTAYWTLVVMKREKASLTETEIEEVWVAALLHDIGLDRSPPFGEFTLGGVAVVSELSARFGWPRASELRASEAITLNPNSHVDRERFGLMAWAMNVGGFAETSRGPYRKWMHPDNLRELETMYPRDGFHASMPAIVDRELERFPNQRFAVLKKIGFVRRRLHDR